MILTVIGYKVEEMNNDVIDQANQQIDKIDYAVVNDDVLVDLFKFIDDALYVKLRNQGPKNETGAG